MTIGAVFPPSGDPDTWYTPRENFYYHPHRISSGNNWEKVLQLCKKLIRPLPVQLVQAKGYLSTCYENDKQITVHILAEDYDVDIDHELDRIRFHRSRLNLVNKVEPIGIDGVVKLESSSLPTVFTPFNETPATVTVEGKTVTVTLPEKCSYAILQFKK